VAPLPEIRVAGLGMRGGIDHVFRTGCARRRSWHRKPPTGPFIESVGDPTLKVGPVFARYTPKMEAPGVGDALGWYRGSIDCRCIRQRRILVGSPLAVALGRGQWPAILCRAGWRDGPAAQAWTMARSADPIVLRLGRHLRLQRGHTVYGVLSPDHSVDGEERGMPWGLPNVYGDDQQVTLARRRWALRGTHANGFERDRGHKMRRGQEAFLRRDTTCVSYRSITCTARERLGVEIE